MYRIRATITLDIYMKRYIRKLECVRAMYIRMLETRMDAARKVEVEKLLYAALVSADTTRD